MRLLIASLLLLGTSAAAQSPRGPAEPKPQTPTTEPAAKPEAPKSEPRAGTPEERVFKPSEEVSADKEVDFPADL